MTPKRIRVVVIEDQWMIRDGIAAIADVADHIEVVATGADGHEALGLVNEHKPDVILMDIKMPNLDGIEATRLLLESHPDLKVLILTTFIEESLIRQVLDAGAAGYLTKDITAEDLATAITGADASLIQLSPPAIASITRGQQTSLPNQSALQAAVDGLTEREREVLRALATGATNAEIAEQLYVSAGTVKNHVSSILRQLRLRDRTRAAVVANQVNLRLDGSPE